MQSEQLYDYVAVLEDEMVEWLDADAEQPDQSPKAQEDRAAAFLVTEVGEYINHARPMAWAQIAAYALAVGGQRNLDGVPEGLPRPDDEIPF